MNWRINYGRKKRIRAGELCEAVEEERNVRTYFVLII